jgi:hypothetical protein
LNLDAKEGVRQLQQQKQQKHQKMARGQQKATLNHESDYSESGQESLEEGTTTIGQLADQSEHVTKRPSDEENDPAGSESGSQDEREDEDEQSASGQDSSNAD